MTCGTKYSYSAPYLFRLWIWYNHGLMGLMFQWYYHVDIMNCGSHHVCNYKLFAQVRCRDFVCGEQEGGHSGSLRWLLLQVSFRCVFLQLLFPHKGKTLSFFEVQYLCDFNGHLEQECEVFLFIWRGHRGWECHILARKSGKPKTLPMYRLT